MSALIRAVIVASVLSALAAAQPSSTTLKVVGLDGTVKSLGLAELQALPQVDITDSGSSAVTRYRGPTVRSVVTLAGAPEGRALRGPSMTIVVLAEASDGYKVAYALAELDEQFGARSAIVALAQNSQPLPTSDGPMRIVLPGETHRARWIRQLTTLRLVRVGDGARRYDSLRRMPGDAGT